MKTIAIISQKGGTGKTTLALNLAVAAERSGQSTVIIDLDPQASAKGWHDHRQAEAPVVISSQASQLSKILATAETHGAKIIIIDTAPHSETSALTSARAADLILIPCRPGIFDLRAITTSVDLAKLSKTPAVAILNAAPPRGTLPDEAEQAIQAIGLEVSPIRLGQRAAFVHSLTAGQGVLEYEPSGKAAEEINDVYLWVRKQASM